MWLYRCEMDPRAGASRQDRKDYSHIFNDEGPYPFDKTLTVYMSGLKKPVVLRLRGVVHEKKLSLNELYPQRRGSLALKKLN